MAMTPLPPAPSSADPNTFDDRADDLLGDALPLFVEEANALQVDVTTKQQTASDAAATATTKAGEAGGYAAAAGDSAGTAAAKAGEAAASAAAASDSQSATATSETNAAQSATAAANSAASVDPQNLSADYAGPNEPVIKWPYMTWADTGTGTFKRRNAANSAWVIEGRLLRAHLPVYALADVPTIDIGPIHIIGKGPAEWIGGAYQPLISGVPSATFAEIDALTSDQGPILCSDMPGSPFYTWVNTAYFTGYRSGRCGEMPDVFVDTPRPWELLMTGGVWNINDPKHKRVIALLREQGKVCPAANWIKGQGMIADLGSGNWKAPDEQDMFMRKSGTDADTANPAGVGVYQPDAIQNITGQMSGVHSSAGGAVFSGALALYTPAGNPNDSGTTNQGEGRLGFSFDASRVARTSVETRAAATRVAPVILV